MIDGAGEVVEGRVEAAAVRGLVHVRVATVPFTDHVRRVCKRFQSTVVCHARPGARARECATRAEEAAVVLDSQPAPFSLRGMMVMLRAMPERG